MKDIRQKFTDIMEQVEKKVFDSYLLKYVEKPVIDKDKLLVLISIMDRLELSYRTMQTLALSTMLIQIALDTHDRIMNSTLTDEKSRQLTVLAGDYYSGLYYKYLADSDDILMIKSLSDGVKAINESKVMVYQKESSNLDKLMENIMIIESSLLTKFSEYFKVDLWNDFHANLFFFKRVIIERSHFLHSESSVIFDAMKKIIFPQYHGSLTELSNEQKNYLLKTADHYLNVSSRTVQQGIQQLPYLNDLLEGRISSILNQYQPIVKTYVEEG